MEKIRVAYSSISGNTASLWVSYEHGFFRKHGLDVDLVFFPGGSSAIQAVTSGEVALAQMAGSAIVQSRLRGSDVVLVAGLINTLTFQVIVDKNIAHPSLLKGRSIGVTRYGSSTDFAARYAVEKWGLIPPKDITVVELGSMPGLLSGLEAGTIHAAMLSAPFTLHARKLGFTVLADLQMLGLEYQHTGIAASEALIKSRPDLIRNFLRAYVEGIHFFKTNREKALATMGKYLKTNDIEALAETYESIGLTLLQEKPYPTLKGIQVILQELAGREPKARNAKAEQFVNTTFVRELDTSGVIARLYKPSAGATRDASRSASPAGTVKSDSNLGQKVARENGLALDAKSQRISPASVPAPRGTQRDSVGQEYTIKAGDTLSKLAERFYGYQWHWGKIYAANKNTVKNPHFLYVGQKIVIPPESQPET